MIGYDMTLLTKLRQFNEIETFKITIFQLKANHRYRGGRYFFIPNKSGQVKLNDIAKQSYILFKKISQQRDPTQNYAVLKKTLEKMKELEESSNEALKKRFIWIRLCTRICRAFGNFWYDRNRYVSRMETFLLELEQRKSREASHRKHPLVKQIEETTIPPQVQEYCQNLMKGKKEALASHNHSEWDETCEEIIHKLEILLKNDQWAEAQKVFRGLKKDPSRFLVLAMNFLHIPGYSINQLMTRLEKDRMACSGYDEKSVAYYGLSTCQKV